MIGIDRPMVSKLISGVMKKKNKMKTIFPPPPPLNTMNMMMK